MQCPNVPYVLIIVDMQERFSLVDDGYMDWDDTLDGCADAITQARKDGAAILFVEYANYGPTLPTVRANADGYPYQYQVTKYDDDGSAEIDRALVELGIENAGIELRFCGVNFSACVERTIYGLTHSFYYHNIVVIENACNQPYYWEESTDSDDYGIGLDYKSYAWDDTVERFVEYHEVEVICQ